jgi:hypothetical protein
MMHGLANPKKKQISYISPNSQTRHTSPRQSYTTPKNRETRYISPNSQTRHTSPTQSYTTPKNRQRDPLHLTRRDTCPLHLISYLNDLAYEPSHAVGAMIIKQESKFPATFLYLTNTEEHTLHSQ